MRIRQFLLLLLMMTMLATVCLSQQIGPAGKQVGSNSERGAQYYIGSQNELLMAINIWGLVAKPGQYLVPSSTDLITLISVAGGPLVNARLDNVKIVRSSSAGSEVMTINIKKFMKTGDDRLIPKLQPGDMVMVSGSLSELSMNVATVVSQIATIVSAYYLIFVIKH